MSQYAQLRAEYPTFRYVSYDIQETATTLDVTYHFEIVGLSAFAPRWSFPKSDRFPLQTENNATLHEMLFALGLVELVSYWKITCSPRVEILAGSVTDAQIAWFKRLYYHGLGEFFYCNGITADEDTFMDMVSLGTKPAGEKMVVSTLDGCLVPIGGGKDSAVTLELLSYRRDTNYGYIINPRGATLETVKAAGYDDSHLHVARRTLDKNMLELNKQGFLNGHTPFSAVVAFSALVTAYLHHLRYIVLSNESSANESTVEGSTVNHQYSKSFAFEQDFCDYEATYIGSGISYFSLLRPLSEYQIAGLFSKYTAYHKIFRSCNAGSKEDKWCGNCPKCLFVFLILSPFLPHAYLCDIFGKDLTEDKNMLPLFEQLIGMRPEKPFECVGSRDEVNTAVTVTIKDMEAKGETLPLMFDYYKTTALYAEYAAKENAYATYFDTAHLLPHEFEQLINGR